MKLSFVIRTKNESKWIGNCLYRIYNQDYDGPIEVIVIDSGSQDNTVALARDMGARVISYDKEDRWSWGRAINLGIQHSDSEVIVILSAHCLISTKSFLQTVVNTLKTYSSQSLAAIYIRQEPIRGVNVFEEVDTLSCFPALKEPVKLDRIKFGISNSCAVVKRLVWENVPFDENLLSGEDGFWAGEVLKKGYHLLYLPTISVYHSHYFSVEDWYRRWYGRYFSFFHIVHNYPKYVPFQECIKNYLIKGLPMPMMKLLSTYLYYRDCRNYRRYIKETYLDFYKEIKDTTNKVVWVKQKAFEQASKDWKCTLNGKAVLPNDYYVPIPNDVYHSWTAKDSQLLKVSEQIDPSSIQFKE